MKRDAVITALLIIAGIILAFLLFGAGAFWQGGSSPMGQARWFPRELLDCVYLTR